MSARRTPLSANPNVANSPLRAQAANSGIPKPKRTLAQIQREEHYGQPPPTKRQMLDHASGTQRLLKSPSQTRVTKSHTVLPQRRPNQPTTIEAKATKERSSQYEAHRGESMAGRHTQKEVDEIEAWQKQFRARFPKMVFFFDSVAPESRHKLGKQIASLGAREEKFFSIDITHVVTTRAIPNDKSLSSREDRQSNDAKDATHNHQDQDQVQTINPSLLSRPSEPAVKRNWFDPELRSRKPPVHPQDNAVRVPKRSTDILTRAKDMGKKVWTLEKLQRILTLLVEPDPRVSAAIAFGTPVDEARQSQDRNLFQLLHNERVNGPSDRDQSVNSQELHYFKGPYIHIYDVDLKQKPIMVREYEKVADKTQGAWPQFRTATLGRCPFVEDLDIREAREARHTRAQPKPKPKPVAQPVVEAKPVLAPPAVAPPKPVTGKRTIGEMENSHSRNSSVASTEFVQPRRPSEGKTLDSHTNAFTSRAAAARQLGGEPVASGVQPSNVTSAIRSQMISSTAATPGVITGLSKEVHGLQRQVLKRNSSATSQGLASRGSTEASFREDACARRSTTAGRTSSRRLEYIGENHDGRDKETEEKQVRRVEKRSTKSKEKELKPGYCENCQVKYDDFDEHILSRKHRNFAEDSTNWTELDDLLSQLERKRS